MKTSTLIKINDTKLASFYQKNPSFDILTHNFLDHSKVKSLSIKGTDKDILPKLMAYQRLLRLHPDVAVAQELLADKLDSSIKITNIGQTVFVKTYGDRFGKNGAETARKLYDAATHSKNKVMHLLASAKNVAASPNFSTMLFNPIAESLSSTFQDLASYQDYFGNLDYCDCEECKSIFGPAAYLVDLLRIIDRGITKPNTSIPSGLHLFDRRPDLQTIELTCENTNGLIPYLQIVNNLLASTLENALRKSKSLIGDDLYLTLANTYYPFNLPFNLPLQQVETVMNNQNIALSDIAAALTKGTTISADQARKILGLSVETLSNLKSPPTAQLPAVLSANYGLTVTTGNLNGLDQVNTFLQQTSLSLTDLNAVLTENLSAKELFDVSGNYTPSVFGPAMILTQQGSSVNGSYATDGILKGTIDGLVMTGQWFSATQAAPAINGDFQFTFSADGSSFTGKWSKGLGMAWETTNWNGTLKGTSTQGIIPHSLYINAPLAQKQYLQIVSAQTGDTIALQNLATLDRLNRFIRLSALMGWSYEDTNWILTTLLGTNDISDTTFTELAKIKQSITVYNIDLNLLSCMWFDLKTIGMGQGSVSAAPFDVLFNSAVSLQETGKYYRPVIKASVTSFVNPLYTDQPVLYVVDQDLYSNPAPSDATKLLVSQGQVIIRGIPSSQDNIQAIALAAFGKVATIELTVSNLSVLYRHIMLAKQLNTTIDRYVLLLKLLNYGSTTAGVFLIQPTLDRDAVLQILGTANSIQASGFTVYDIDYIVNQTTATVPSPYVNNGYRLSAAPGFLNTLRVLLISAACTADSFTYSSLTGDASAQVVENLSFLKFIDASGLIVKDPSTLTAADWASVYIGTLLQPDDFAGSIFTAQDSELIFAGLLKQAIITVSGHLMSNPSKTDWTKILIGKPAAPLTAAQQKAVLTVIQSMQSNPDTDQQQFITSQLGTIQTHQEEVFANQTGSFFSVKESLASLAIHAVRGTDPAYLEPFVLTDSDAVAKANTFLLNISRILMLQRIPGLSEAQFSSLCMSPAAYGLAGNNTYSYSAILSSSSLKPVVQAFGDNDDQLIQYFGDVWSANPPSTDALQTELCSLTGWSKQQYISIAKVILNDPNGCKTLADVIAVKAVFDLTGSLGIDTDFLQQLNQTTSLPATVASWPAYQATASKLLMTIQATTSSDAVEDQYRTINGDIEGKKRDAMLFLTIAVLGQTWTDITNPRSLYEFLLIDPENSGCSDTSLIEEAMNAAQLYLQRCRLNLEKNVQINTDDIPDVWWEWMMSYRIWEANRQIFVYPENYIVPSLRKSKTSLFANLENTLMQGEVTTDLVESAYIKYLDDFSQFAKLRYVDAYQSIVHDKERGAIDTLFMFARTQEQPYQFYYITRETAGDCGNGSQYLWSEWKNINIKIDSQNVTPVYAFNKLFVFWVEISTSKESGGLTGATGNDTTITTHSNTITKGSIKYSYYNFNEKWVQPQTLVLDKVVNVFSLEKDIYGSFRDQFTDTGASCWTQVSVIHIQPENYVGTTNTPEEKLVVYFGPLANNSNLSIAPAIPSLANDSTSVYAFKDMLKQAYFNLEQMKSMNVNGDIPLCSHYVINEVSGDQIILSQYEYLNLANDTLSTLMPPSFAIEISNENLAIETNYSTIVTNNSDGIVSEYTNIVKGPQSVTDSSFVVYPYIDQSLSATIHTQINAKMSGIITNGIINKTALSQSIPAISSKLGLTEGLAKLVQNRFYELYYGTLILFTNVVHNAEVVPVKNQPNTFILDNNDEAFLLTAINNVIEVIPAILNPDSFVSATITKPTSEGYFKLLSTAPNQYIRTDGTVNQELLQGASPFTIGLILGMAAPYTEAKNIITVMSASTQNITKKNYSKIDAQLRITATLSSDCFVSSTISRSTSESYFTILSTAPNNYIRLDGSVNLLMAIGANEMVIAPLLGLQPTDPAASKVVFVLKSAANLITRNSFTSAAINPDNSLLYINAATSASYFTILSTSPNNFILPNGTVNIDLLSTVSNYTMSLLLGSEQDPNGFVVAKVMETLWRDFGPVTLGYVFPDDLDAKKNPGMYYQNDNIYSLQFAVERISTGAINPISHALTFGGIDDALSLTVQQPPVTINKPFSNLGPSTASLVSPLQGSVIIPPSIITNQEVDFTGPYGMYYWELFFHTPFLVASMLNANQQFSDAESWMQYIFNPTAQNRYLTQDIFIKQGPLDIDPAVMENMYSILTTAPNQYIDKNGVVTSLVEKSSPYALSILLNLSMNQATEILNFLNNYYVIKAEVRAWQFDPFRNYTLQTLLQNLSSCAQTAVYNDDPFDPDAIARLRIGTYEKTIMMKYIDNLLDWGDFEFTQYSMESITMARMYYCYANDLLGPKPISLGTCKDSFPVTFQDIAARYKNGDIPQFLIDMEHLSSQGAIAPPAGDPAKPYNDLGYYFCIPDNDQLTAYWTRVEDRLYKIRHCLNIDGVAQPLPLFQPPLNPMDLVRASAQGGNVLGIASQQQQNISNYRFSFIIERAKAYAELVNDFGNNLLSALEKSDSEALAVLNLNQSRTILNMTMIIKNKQLETQQDQLTGLQQSLLSAQNRNTFYTALINAGYNASENSALAYMQSSIEVQEVIAGIQGVSIVGYLAPCIFGFSDGGMKFGDAINMGAQMLQTTSQILSQKGGSAETVGQYQRRAEDWQLQQQTAQFDINQIQDQILSQQATIESSQQEISIQQKSIDQNDELITFYQNKFTNKELYQWMISRLSAVYFQAYKLALDTALTAQMCYQYELDRNDSYITFGYWDSLHKGLLAADGLKLSLAQLDNAYTENNKRRMEIEKTISLKSLNPEAFYAFTSGINQGSLMFSLTEELFDRDFPSHYCRRIKTVLVSVPAVVGPYQNIHATLTQNTNLVVLTPDKDVVNYAIYQTAPQKSGNAPSQPNAKALRQNWASSQQIALSKSADDSGMFTLNYDDPRYLPFEGTGAVSSWTLSMPPNTNQIDFSGISDIILTVYYSAKEGGSPFGRDVTGLYSGTDKQYQNIRINSFDLGQAFANNWYKLFQMPPDAQKQQILTFPVTSNVVLPNLKNVKLSQIVIDLETAAGSVISNNQTGLLLQVGTVIVKVNITNNKGTISDTDMNSITQWQEQNWSLIFLTDKIPQLCTNNQLDASKLLDSIVFIAYTSNM
ncbi:neuraminidase-like domain-containing protein [Pedobacter cryoconitis]|uniref:Virulence plasmid A protein n=1 Tax=Pedobacter cryoconitis TaxID=188932 RepID=A0A7X0J938_9SPHI|nr:neuraminidase-like domain-containing protein [Pedobacter cryoconitis]MBB6503010.1 hypothetical protein [Pedobacter cryoconitis]